MRRFIARRGVILTRAKASQVVEAAKGALRLPPDERAVLGRVLAADLVLLSSVEAQITAAETMLAELLPATPAAILLTLPGVAVVRASNYGAGIGDPGRFPDAAVAYRASGLVPALCRAPPQRSAHLPGGLGRAALGDHRGRPGAVPTRSGVRRLPRAADCCGQACLGGRRRRRAPGAPAGLRHVAHPACLRPGKVGQVGGGGRHGEDRWGPPERSIVPAVTCELERREGRRQHQHTTTRSRLRARTWLPDRSAGRTRSRMSACAAGKPSINRRSNGPPTGLLRRGPGNGLTDQTVARRAREPGAGNGPLLGSMSGPQGNRRTRLQITGRRRRRPDAGTSGRLRPCSATNRRGLLANDINVVSPLRGTMSVLTCEP